MDDFYDELEDAFIDKPISSQKFIFGLIKTMCKDAKAGKLNKTCSVNLLENGQLKQEFVKLKEVNLEEFKLPSDPNWLPEDYEKDSIKKWEHKVTDKTMEYVEMYCKFVGLRFKKYNESLTKSSAETISKLKEQLAQAPKNLKESIQKQIETEEKAIEERQKTAEKNVPTSIEQCIYNQIYPQLHSEVMKNIDTEFDKEFEEMYPPTKEEKPKPVASK